MSPRPGLAKVCVIVAFHMPVMALARRQIESLCRQQGVVVQGVAVLDGAETIANAELRDLLDAAGFTIVDKPEASGVRAAFAAGLAHAVESFHGPRVYFAFCDQDDVWHDDKLVRSVEHLEQCGATLVYCDAAVTDDAGAVIAPSLHRYETREAPESLLEVVLLNSTSGMTAVFTADTARLAVRLMHDYDGDLLHDHITAAAAASLGRTAFLDVALVDYVQHDRNNLGARVHHAAWKKRALGLGHLALYRQTSAALFAERRRLCLALQREGRLPGPLATMFLAGDLPNIGTLILRYDMALIRLLMKRQFRRAMLCLRMYDIAFATRCRQIAGRKS